LRLADCGRDEIVISLTGLWGTAATVAWKSSESGHFPVGTKVVYRVVVASLFTVALVLQ